MWLFKSKNSYHDSILFIETQAATIFVLKLLYFHGVLLVLANCKNGFFVHHKNHFMTITEIDGNDDDKWKTPLEQNKLQCQSILWKATDSSNRHKGFQNSFNWKAMCVFFSTIGCLAFSCEKYMSLAESALKSLQLGGRRKSKQKLSWRHRHGAKNKEEGRLLLLLIYFANVIVF